MGIKVQNKQERNVSDLLCEQRSKNCTLAMALIASSSSWRLDYCKDKPKNILRETMIQYRSRCYWISTSVQLQSWTEARQRCINKGLDLANIQELAMSSFYRLHKLKEALWQEMDQIALNGINIFIGLQSKVSFLAME